MSEARARSRVRIKASASGRSIAEESRRTGVQIPSGPPSTLQDFRTTKLLHPGEHIGPQAYHKNNRVQNDLLTLLIFMKNHPIFCISSNHASVFWGQNRKILCFAKGGTQQRKIILQGLELEFGFAGKTAKPKYFP